MSTLTKALFYVPVSDGCRVTEGVRGSRFTALSCDSCDSLDGVVLLMHNRRPLCNATAATEPGRGCY